jgi:hypothetical protein
LARRTRLALAALAGALALLAGCAGPGDVHLLDAHVAQGPPAPLRAGTADVVFTPPPGYPLGGYGGGERRAEWPFYLGVGWPGRLALWAHQVAHEDGPEPADMLAPSTGVHDELSARALVLRPADGPPVAIVRIDAIGVTRELHEAVVGRLADLGYTRDTVLLAATHTHSGVGSYMRAPLARLAGTDDFRPEVEARIVQACADAVRTAHASAVPAAIAVGSAVDRGPDGKPRLAGNRRARKEGSGGGAAKEEDIDPEVLLVRVDDVAAGRPLAVVLGYGIHGTVLRTSNHLYSGDVADGLEDALSRRLGGATVLFLNGAEGDVGPGRVDGSGAFERIHSLGEAMADLVLPVLSRLPASQTVRLASAVGDIDMGDAHTSVALGRGRYVDHAGDWGTWAMEPLMLPANVLLWALGATNVHARLTWDLALGLDVGLSGLVGRSVTRVGGLRLRCGREDVALLCLPGEPTHDVGLAVKALARARGATHAFCVGLALDHIGYIASPKVYREGGYEAQFTLFGPDTATSLERALDRVLDALGYAAPRGVTAAGVSGPP